MRSDDYLEMNDMQINLHKLFEKHIDDKRFKSEIALTDDDIFPVLHKLFKKG